MEQGTGVEPAYLAWEARVIPIYQPCIGWIIIAQHQKKRKQKTAA